MDLDGKHRELLYYRAIRQWTPQRIAAFLGKTDRNVRKVYNTMIGNIRRKMYMRLYPRYIAGKPLTSAQKEFFASYEEQLDDVQKSKIMRTIEEQKRRPDRRGEDE
jgi:hypothetical protein